jgi:Tfp pilus assembly protein PilF
MARWLRAACIIALVPLWGCAADPAGLLVTAGPGGREQALGRAALAMDEQRFRDGKAVYEQILRADPDDRAARLGLAEAQLALGDAAAARQAFAALAGDEAVRTPALQGLGLANLRAGDDDGARAALAAALERDAGLWRAWSGIAQVHDRAAEWDDAAAAYEQALAKASQPELVLNNWGVSLLARGEHNAAAGRFAEALRARPDFATAKANLRLALAMGGRYQDVLADASADELPEVLNNLGYVAMLQGDLPRAESYLHRAIETSPSFYARAHQNLQRLDLMRQAPAAGPAP